MGNRVAVGIPLVRIDAPCALDAAPPPISARVAWRCFCLALLVAAVISTAGCNAPHEPSRASIPPNSTQRAGQPVNPLAVVGHVAAARRAALRGDQNGIQTNVGAIQKDMLRSIRMPDPARRINHEAARAAVRPIAGVRSAVWMDHENLLVMVGGARYRTMQTIDNVCSALNPLGDTLAVVVNVQNVQARTSEEADTLSRNCQLARGERAFMQRKRKVDVHDSQLRQAFKAQQGRR